MGEEMPYAVEFIKSLSIITEATDAHFKVRITTDDPEINEFITALCEVGDSILKTPIKLKF